MFFLWEYDCATSLFKPLRLGLDWIRHVELHDIRPNS